METVILSYFEIIVIPYDLKLISCRHVALKSSYLSFLICTIFVADTTIQSNPLYVFIKRYNLAMKCAFVHIFLNTE